MSVSERDEAASHLEQSDHLQHTELKHIVDEVAGKCRLYHPDEIDEEEGAWLQSDIYYSMEVSR